MRELARRIGTSERHVRLLEEGVCGVKPDRYRVLASALGVSVRELLPKDFFRVSGKAREPLAGLAPERIIERETVAQFTGRVCKEARARRGLSLEWVAEQVGVCRQMLSQMERGGYGLMLHRYPALARALVVRVESLLPPWFSALRP